MTFSLILDLLIVALLVPTIIFAVVLNNRLAALRKNRDDLARLVAAFNEATVRAESGIPRLRKTSEDASRALEEQVERARILRDDLAFMVERAEGMAARLEDAVRQGRGAEGTAPVASPAAARSASRAAGRPAPGATGQGAASSNAAGSDLAAGAAATLAAAGVDAASLRARATAQSSAATSGQSSLLASSGRDIESAAAAAESLAQRGPAGYDGRGAARRPAPPATPSRPAAPAGGNGRAPDRSIERPAGPSLGAALARDSGGTLPAGDMAEDDGRSEAERELLRALQSAR